MSYDQNKYKIMMKNSLFIISRDELKKIKKELKKIDIDFIIYEERAIDTSFLQSFNIYINNPLTELIVAGIIMPAVYDILKKSLKSIIFKLRKSKTNIQYNKERVIPILQFENENGILKVPIPDNISDENMDKYLELAMKSIDVLKKESKYTEYTAEYDDKKEIIKIITISN